MYKGAKKNWIQWNSFYRKRVCKNVSSVRICCEKCITEHQHKQKSSTVWEISCVLQAAEDHFIGSHRKAELGGACGDISWVAEIGGGGGAAMLYFVENECRLCVVLLSGELLRVVCFIEGWQRRDRAALLLSQSLCLLVLCCGHWASVTRCRLLDLSG